MHLSGGPAMPAEIRSLKSPTFKAEPRRGLFDEPKVA
jgi:hypothetical protein